MILQKMHAIEYNSFMTLLDMFIDGVGNKLTENDINYPVDVLPCYPRKLTKFDKPSIIMRRVVGSSSPIGLGGFLGQFFDGDKLSDTYGRCHDITMQIDICTDEQIPNMMLTSIIEDILNESSNITLYDYTLGQKISIGTIKLMDEISITNITDEPGLNSDYISAIRFDINIIQVLMPSQEYVDLSKWIKQRHTIKL